jgi:hypothetical protein
VADSPPTSSDPKPSSHPGTPPPGSVRRSSAPPDPFGGVDRVARVQTIAAIVLGLVLIAIPLYLWRRPRSDAPPVTSAMATDGAAGAVGAAASAPNGKDGKDGGAPPASSASAAPVPAAPPIVLSDAKIMECHDPGSKRTRPEDCDHLAAFEKSMATAISSAAACVPASAGGGSLVYVADVSFARKRKPIDLFVPRDGRGLRTAHGTPAVVKDCTAAVKRGLVGISLDGAAHAHQRYKVAITATYAGSSGPGAP